MDMLKEFEAKCIRLGELQVAQQAIRFHVTLVNGNTLQGEISDLSKEIERLKAEISRAINANSP